MRTFLKILAGGFGIILGLATLITFFNVGLSPFFHLTESAFAFGEFLGSLIFLLFAFWATYRLLKFAIKREKQATDSKYLDENL
jgi:threonine/homoserine/homoserine lactone efflux protein